MKSAWKYISISLALALLLSFAGCAGHDSTQQTDVTQTNAPQPISDADALSDPTDESKEASGDFSVSGPVDVAVNGSVYTVTAAGEYTISGRLEEGRIVVDAGDEDEVVLILSDASVSSTTGAPIEVVNASEVTVRAEEGSYNVVSDLRSGDPDASDDEADAAIWSDCDLKLTGKGTLIVTSTYDNGVKSKDDVSVKDATLKVSSPGVALKGNDSVTVKSGSLILVSTGGDGVKTSNSDVSSKGNQRGDVTILSGHVDIYAACDGISAAHDVLISQDEDECIVNIYTASYSEYADGYAAASDLYLVVPTAYYSDGYDYYFYFYNDDDSDGVWVQCSYETMVYSGRSAAYYGLSAKQPGGYQNMLVNIVASGETPDGSNYAAGSGGETVNGSMNGYLITDVSSGRISGDWVTLSSGSGNSSGKTTYSSKGVKAENAISVTGGTITVYSMDDGLHANAGEALENGETSIGSISISGGTITVTSADDGIHADGTLTISDGYVNIVQSHEGLEGNVINIGGGSVYVYGNDDGINACKGSQTPLVNVTGGYVEVTTPSGDTDAIDSNGSFTVSGGFVLVKGGAAMSGMAGSVDVDGSITVSGGSVVALGGICQTPSGNSVCTYVSSSASLSAGDYTLVDSSGKTLLSFTLDGAYSGCWISSDALTVGGSYSLLRSGSEVLSWTQSSSTEGSAGMFGGMGGMGGMGGRW